MADQKNSRKRESRTLQLNVLLHGAFTFVQDKKMKRMVAAITKLKGHAYRAGSWLAETELRGGASYELKGVNPNSVLRFKKDQNLLVKFQSELLSTKPVPYATLRFPYAKKITSLRVAEIKRKFFSHSEDLVEPKPLQSVATLQVLTYDIENENKLELRADSGGGHYWEPAFTRNYVNLHIFSSEDSYHKPSNTGEDLNQCAALLGVKLLLNTRFLPASVIRDDPHALPDGVADEETETLAVRTLRMARLGRLVVQGGDANLAWRGNDALDGDPEACGPIFGCLYDFHKTVRR